MNEPSININSNGMYSYGTVRKVTNITREFDEEGRLVREIETVTEYVQAPSYPVYPYTTYGGSIQTFDGSGPSYTKN